jgi:hypothetical protein
LSKEINGKNLFFSKSKYVMTESYCVLCSFTTYIP